MAKDESGKAEILPAHCVEFMHGDEKHVVAVARKDDTFQCEFIKWNKEGTLWQSTALLLSREALSALIGIALKHHAEYFTRPPAPPDAGAQGKGGGA